MSTGSVGSDEKISGSKVQPLESGVKDNTPLDMSSRGVAGTNTAIDQARIDPLGGQGQYRHPAAHADSQGVVGRDEAVQGTKIEPLDGGGNSSTAKSSGLDDEQVDGARIDPVGSVREELSGPGGRQ